MIWKFAKGREQTRPDYLCADFYFVCIISARQKTVEVYIIKFITDTIRISKFYFPFPQIAAHTLDRLPSDALCNLITLFTKFYNSKARMYPLYLLPIILWNNNSARSLINDNGGNIGNWIRIYLQLAHNTGKLWRLMVPSYKYLLYNKETIKLCIISGIYKKFTNSIIVIKLIYSAS